MNHRLGIIGGGRAAWAFGSTWKRIGWPIAGVATRSEPRVAHLLSVEPATIDDLARSAELILVAVSDRAIEQVDPPDGSHHLSSERRADEPARRLFAASASRAPAGRRAVGSPRYAACI